MSLTLRSEKTLDFAFRTMQDVFAFVHMASLFRYVIEDGPKQAATTRLRTKLDVLAKSQGVTAYELLQIAILKTMVDHVKMTVTQI